MVGGHGGRGGCCTLPPSRELSALVYVPGIIKILGTNSWLAQAACVWDGAKAAGVWARRCRRAGEGLLGPGGDALGCGMSSACSCLWSSMKSRAFKLCLVLSSAGWLLAFPLPCPIWRPCKGSCHLQLASDPHHGRTFWLMATTEQYHVWSRLPQARESAGVEVGKSYWSALLQPVAHPRELKSLS